MAHRRYSRSSTIKRNKVASRNKSILFIAWVKKSWIRIALLLSGIAFLGGGATVLWWSKDLPNPQTINSRRILESTKIYDRSGEHLLYEIGDVHRTVIPLDQISSYLRQATLAAEDDQFYQHHGLDFSGILRGVILKPLSGQRAQGGSTITQQLIKNAILTPERTVRRKVKEAVLALEMEQRFSKDEILSMYLNDIPYGSQAHGIEAASKTFFNKSARELTLAESATLASLPKAPTYYSPYGSHFEDLKRRQEHILDRMASLNMISSSQAEEAKQENLEFEARRESIRAPHFVFYVKEQLDEQFGERIVEQGGLTILTSLDIDMQTAAEEVFTEKAATLNKLGASNAALVALDPKTGDILSMVGSLDYFNEDIDGNVNVTVRHRSPGSSIKPFVYAAAFEKGYTPETILVDAETDFGQGYIPKNYDLSQRGPVTIRTSLANSLNIPAVKALYLAGIKDSTTLAQRLGMTSLNDPDRYGLSLVLGGGEVRLLDETSAYGTFANEGVRLPHRAILKVQDSKEVLFDSSETQLHGEQVLQPQVARQITDILSDNNARALTFGTRSSLQLGSRPVAAKTGTTQDYRDGWTVGYTPSIAAGVWVGNNDYTPMSDRSAGANTAAPLWNAFMQRALKNKPIEQFTKPEHEQNIPHGVLRGEIPEIKGKWDKSAGVVYTADCPIAVGQTKTFKELHSILFYVRRGNPRGNVPSNAENDSQFDRWESSVAAWRDQHNIKTADNPEEPHYGPSLPEPTCGIENQEDLPKVTIVEPNKTVVTESPVQVTVEVDSQNPITEVRFLLDGKEIQKRRSDEPYTASFSFENDFSGRKTLQVLAIAENKLIGRAHRTFIINPDDAPPQVTLHTPQENITLQPSSFPYTVKVTAKDSNGIETVDVLYRKEGDSGTRRIGRTSTQSQTAPDRYEVKWDDSPGPGTYEVYIIAYDKTGNFTETQPRQVEIQ